MFRFILALSEQQILGPVPAGHTNGAPQVPRLPGFPVESGVFDQLHVVLFKENHISGRGERGEVGNLGTLGMTNRRG
jgi:hypothetical protein